MQIVNYIKHLYWDSKDMLREIHRVNLEERVHNERLFCFNVLDINPRQKEHQDLLFLLCKRGIQKDLIDDLYQYKQSVNRHIIGALLLTIPLTTAIKKELKKLKPGIKVTQDEIHEFIKTDVLKREVIDSEAGIDACKQVIKYSKKQER